MSSPLANSQGADEPFLLNMANVSFDDTVNASMDQANVSTCTLAPDPISDACRFWIQGVLLCVVGIGGVVGNTISIFVLSSPEMLSVFNQILVVMTAFDTVYLLTSVAEFSLVESFALFTSPVYDKLFVYFLYPVHNVVLCCSIFSHVLLAFERYLAVCHPELVYTQRTRGGQGQGQMANGNGPNSKRKKAQCKAAANAVRKKVLFYIIPMVIFCVLLNVSRWFELKLEEFEIPAEEAAQMHGVNIKEGSTQKGNETAIVVAIAGTWLRYNQKYVTYYLHWTILLCTGIFPLAAMAYLNTRIYFRIKEVQKVRTSSAHARNEPNYAATLASIVIIFVVCHLPRIIKTVFEVIVTDQLLAAGQHCDGINPAKCLANLNNFILTLNAASSFLVYCFVGTFGTKFVQVLTGCCKHPRSKRTHSRKNRVQEEDREASKIEEQQGLDQEMDELGKNQSIGRAAKKKKKRKANDSLKCPRSASLSVSSGNGGHRLRRLKDMDAQEAKLALTDQEGISQL